MPQTSFLCIITLLTQILGFERELGYVPTSYVTLL